MRDLPVSPDDVVDIASPPEAAITARELWWRRRLADLLSGITGGLIVGGFALFGGQPSRVALGVFAIATVGFLLVVPAGRKLAGEPAARELAAKYANKGKLDD